MNEFSKKIKYNDIYYKKLLKRIEPIRKNYLKNYKTLTKNEKESIEFYKLNGYRLINEFLYKNQIIQINFNNQNIDCLYNILKNEYDSIINHINNIEKSINKYNLPNNITVFRGIYGEYIKTFNKLKVNDILNISSFMSTSLDPQVAFNFTYDYKKKQKKILIEIKLPKNTNVSYLQFTNKNEYLGYSEFEILINRGANLKLNKISTIEESFFNLDDLNWKKYLNTKNNVKKIYVYHMSLIDFNNIELPIFNKIINNIDLNKIINQNIMKNLYYIKNQNIDCLYNILKNKNNNKLQFGG